jgi:general secretion pathway protein F
MPRFQYRAKKGPTEIVKGVVDAKDRDEAVEKISQMGCLPISVDPDRASSAVGAAQKQAVSFSLFAGVRSRDVTVFSRQLSSLIRSGVPILRALSIISEQSDSPAFRQVLAKIAEDVKEGKSFSATLEAWPKVFSPFYVAMVRSGEDSGMLQDVLLRIATYRQKQEEMLSRVRTAMAYPILMALVGVGTVIFMFTFVLPKLMTLFTSMGQELPVMTRIVIAISVFLREKWALLIGAIAAIVLLLVKTSSLSIRRKMTSYIVLHLPLFNRFLLANEFARFCRTLEILIKSGIPILRALSISIPILSNEIVKAELSRSSADLEQGSSFGKSLKKSSIFPPFLVSLVAVGEESGRLDDALCEIADTYEHECDEAVKVMTSLLEPIMILVMGLVVGFIVMAMLLPIFQINTMVS